MSPLIRFLIGGVQKAGTSALASYLADHPALVLPGDKEAHVFDAPGFDEGWGVAEIDALYVRRLPDENGRLAGDAPPIYCLHPRLVLRIARYNPGMRWIILLRDPVDRALSQYRMERGRGTETWPLVSAMLFEHRRLRRRDDDWSTGSPLRLHSYRLRGDYTRQLAALRSHFPAQQLLVLTQAELASAPAATLARVHEFLGVPTPPQAPVERRVFEGNYRPYGRRHPVRLLLNWLLRDEVRDYRQRRGWEG